MSPLALSVRFLQTQTDHRLVELARAGHERAFEALVQRYRRPLLKYCRRLTASEATAEDVLQQALLQAWVALASPEVEVRDARAWLYRIVHNAAMSQLRRPVHDSLEATHGGLAGGAEDELERRLEARAALAGIASLPGLQREVIVSTALEGRSHDEVADALGLTHGAVRGLIYRARAALRAAAAAVVPSPVIHWAVRQGTGAGRSAAIVEVAAGGGSVGVGGLLLKGGAVVAAAGAVATAAGIAGHDSHRHARRVEAGLIAPARAHGPHASGGAGATAQVLTGVPGHGKGSAVLAAVRIGGGAGSSAPGRGHRIARSHVSGFGPSGARSGSGRTGGHRDGGSSGSGGPTGTSGPSGSGGSGSTGSHHESGASSGSGDGGSPGSGVESGSGSGSGVGSGDGGQTGATSASAASGDGSGDGSRSRSGSGSGMGSDGGSGSGTSSAGGSGSLSGSGAGSALSSQSSSPSSGDGGPTTHD